MGLPIWQSPARLTVLRMRDVENLQCTLRAALVKRNLFSDFRLHFHWRAVYCGTMDPQATLNLIRETEDPSERRELIATLRDWIQRGGFEPTFRNPFERYSILFS